jgi:MOSC domain-containing protein YiiM
VTDGVVAAVARSETHTMSKPVRESIVLVAGLGVDGDAHQGVRVKHRSRARRDPMAPNLRQVHLIQGELLDEGFSLAPGELGENVTTRGVDLTGLPVGTRLHLGAAAVVEMTGLRNPCAQLEGIQEGLMEATLDRDEGGRLVRKAGVMGIVVAGGEVRAGDPLRAEPPSERNRPLEPV